MKNNPEVIVGFKVSTFWWRVLLVDTSSSGCIFFTTYASLTILPVAELNAVARADGVCSLSEPG